MDTTNWLVTFAQYILRKQLAHSRWQYLQLQGRLDVAEFRGDRFRSLYRKTKEELRRSHEASPYRWNASPPAPKGNPCPWNKT